jgi:hypothetical protein
LSKESKKWEDWEDKNENDDSEMKKNKGMPLFFLERLRQTPKKSSQSSHARHGYAHRGRRGSIIGKEERP